MKRVKCPVKMTLSFEDVPSGFCSMPYASDPEGYDVAFCSIPYELATKGFAGSADGAAYIRKNVFSYGNVDQPLDIDVGQSIKGADLGKIVVDPSSQSSILAGIEEGMLTILNRGTIPYVLGGNDTSAAAQIRAMAQKFGKFAVAAFTGSLSDSLMAAIADGTADGKNCIQLGVRDNIAPYAEALSGTNVLTASQMDYMTFDQIAEKVKAVAGSLPVLVLFQANFLDPAFVPAAVYPCVGGFSEYETVVMIEKSLVGIDTRMCAVYGLLQAKDSGEVAIENMSEIITKLHAVIGVNLTE